MNQDDTYISYLLTKVEIIKRLKKMNIPFNPEITDKSYYVNKYNIAIKNPLNRQWITNEIAKDAEGFHREKRQREHNVINNNYIFNNNNNDKTAKIDFIPISNNKDTNINQNNNIKVSSIKIKCKLDNISIIPQSQQNAFNPNVSIKQFINNPIKINPPMRRTINNINEIKEIKPINTSNNNSNDVNKQSQESSKKYNNKENIKEKIKRKTFDNIVNKNHYIENNQCSNIKTINHNIYNNILLKKKYKEDSKTSNHHISHNKFITNQRSYSSELSIHNKNKTNEQDTIQLSPIIDDSVFSDNAIKEYSKIKRKNEIENKQICLNQDSNIEVKDSSIQIKKSFSQLALKEIIMHSFDYIQIGLIISAMGLGLYVCIKHCEVIKEFCKDSSNSFIDFIKNKPIEAIKVLIEVLKRIIIKIGLSIKVNFIYLIAVILIGLSINFLYQKLQEKNIANDIYIKIKRDLHEINRSNNTSIEMGISIREIIRKYSSIYLYNKKDFEKKILPLLIKKRENDCNIREFEVQKNGIKDIIWQWSNY